jgi:hypothetical protein
MLRDFFATETPTNVDEQIAAVLKEMDDYGPLEPEYEPLLTKLERLNALKAEKPKPLSRDGIVTAAAHLLGILTIALVERGRILPPNATKQLGRMWK